MKRIISDFIQDEEAPVSREFLFANSFTETLCVRLLCDVSFSRGGIPI